MNNEAERLNLLSEQIIGVCIVVTRNLRQETVLKLPIFPPAFLRSSVSLVQLFPSLIPQ